jgi:CheY-like chemotaxis protein
MTASALGRVLVVDDELGPRESLRMLLKPSYAIQTAENGRTALDLLRRFQPDVVIMDIKMPEMDGLELLRHVKRADPSIEVVMITAYASLETVRHALTNGAFEYLIKPFSRQDLEDVVHRALVRRQTDLGTRGQVARLVEEMRKLSAKTRELEQAEANEQSLRVAQLSILREISRTIVGHLDPQNVTAALMEQLRVSLGYDSADIVLECRPASTRSIRSSWCASSATCGTLGHLVVDNRATGAPSIRGSEPRDAVGISGDRPAQLEALRRDRRHEAAARADHLVGRRAIIRSPDDRIEKWNPAANGSSAAMRCRPSDA